MVEVSKKKRKRMSKNTNRIKKTIINLRRRLLNKLMKRMTNLMKIAKKTIIHTTKKVKKKESLTLNTRKSSKINKKQIRRRDTLEKKVT